MINAEIGADTVKYVDTGVFVPGKVGELGADVGQVSVDSKRYRLDQVMKEICCRHSACFHHQLDRGELRCPDNGDKQIQLVLFRAIFSNNNTGAAANNSKNAITLSNNTLKNRPGKGSVSSTMWRYFCLISSLGG